jgi:cobalt-zinc-cadmium efflux system outer membrane protein
MTTVLGQANSAWPGVPRWAGSLVVGVVLGAAGPVAAVAQEAPLGRDLPGLLAYARAQSPEIRAMHEEAEAAAQRVGPAGALPDPVLRVELMNINNYGTDASPSLLPWKVGETKYTLDAVIAPVGQARAQAGRRRRRCAPGRGPQRMRAWAELAARIKAAYAEYYRATGNERLTTKCSP